MIASSVPPIPNRILGTFHPYTQSLAKRLYRYALRSEMADARFDEDERARSQWYVLLRETVLTANELRHLLWTEWNDTEPEQILVTWVDAIYANDEERSLRPREVILGLSPDHLELYDAFERALETEARLAREPLTYHTDIAKRLEQSLALQKKSCALAKSIGQRQPRTRGDRQLQSLALDYLHSGNYVFKRIYGV